MFDCWLQARVPLRRAGANRQLRRPSVASCPCGLRQGVLPMPTDGSLARWRSRRGLRIAALLAGVSLSAVSAHAQDAIWNLNGTGDFNTSANWTPATVPTGTAIFG